MPIATTCPNCKALFRLADDMAGEKVKCQKCQHIFIVPKADEKTMSPGMSVAKAPMDMELDKAPASAPRAKAAPPIEEEVLEARVEPEEEPERPSRRRTPPPIDGRRDDRPSTRRARREPRSSGSGSTVLIVLLLGGGVLGCIGCMGVGGILVYNANKPVAVAKKGQAPVKFVDDKKFDDQPINKPGLQLKPGAINAAIGADGRFSHFNQLTRFDPRNVAEGWPCKLYAIRMEANRTYQIDLMSQNFDAYLFLLDDANNILDEDDDSGGNLNSRIIFVPQRTGTYYIEATSLNGNGAGGYTLTIQRR